MEKYLAVSKKIEHNLFYDPATLFLDIHPRDMSAYVHKNTHRKMFIAALFIMDPKWKQPKYPDS